MKRENLSKSIDKIAAVIVLAALLSANIACMCVRTVEASPKPDFVVVIDAGHGGIDGGVSGNTSGVRESELNLDISRKLKEKLESAGVKVVMTRKTEAGLYGIFSKGFKKRDMKKRMETANSANPDIFVSVHLNYYSSTSRSGAQVFYKANDKESKNLAEIVQKSFNSLCEKDYSPLVGDYYVLNRSNSAAILCECGFLSNENEEKLLLSNDYRAEIAEKIYQGIESYRYESASGRK